MSERHPPARRRTGQRASKPAARHGHHRPAGRIGLFCPHPRGQPPHPGQRPTPTYTAENGVTVYLRKSGIWPVCEMTEDATLGHALELASAARAASDANYQVVLFQRGDKDTYADFIQPVRKRPESRPMASSAPARST